LNVLDQQLGDVPRTMTGTINQAFLGQDLALVIERAQKEAKRFGDDYISTEHLLLALLAVPSLAKDTLEGVGLEEEDVLAALKEIRDFCRTRTNLPSS
jgi:ATP-dependent Clp protease ATP-binding subunit ClpB